MTILLFKSTGYVIPALSLDLLRSVTIFCLASRLEIPHWSSLIYTYDDLFNNSHAGEKWLRFRWDNPYLGNLLTVTTEDVEAEAVEHKCLAHLWNFPAFVEDEASHSGGVFIG